MYIEEIYLNNYKNYNEEKIKLNNDINIIYGNNAQGKTNLLESIYLLSYGKTFRGSINQNIVNFNGENTYIKLKFFKNNRSQNISFYYDKKLNKKYFKINEVAQNKISNIYGKLNVVTYKPEDIDIIKKGPSIRRNYIDILICSLKPIYIAILSDYNKILKERNSFLKNNKEQYFSNKNLVDFNFLEVLNTKLAEFANKIFIYRRKYIEIIDKIANKFHYKIVHRKDEKLSFEYKSDAENEKKYIEKLKKSEYQDFLRGYTSKGIHRDDIIIKINDRDVSLFGSQGQQKSSILSLKLAEIRIIERENNEKPILLLDDFMSELDEERQKLFIENIKDYQIIITSTSKIIIKDRSNRLFNIDSGKVSNIEDIDNKE